MKGQNLPGPTHCYIRVMDSQLWHRKDERNANPPPMPTFYAEDSMEPLPEEIFDSDLFQFTDKTLTYEEEKKEKAKR